MLKTIKRLTLAAAGVLLATGIAHAADKPAELRLDYAYYSPPSLVLKKFGWLEEDLKTDGVPVKWALSQGSNRALEFLNSGSVDFGSTAGLAAVLSKANGNPIKSVYVYSRPEWTALLVPKDSPIKSVKDLKGKKVAATKGTDPFLFLLRSLHQEGLSKSDVEILALQHADGRSALEQGRVDAWAGLDPLMAGVGAGRLQVAVSQRRNNTYGFLNTSERFASEHPACSASSPHERRADRRQSGETAKLVSEEPAADRGRSPAVVAQRFSKGGCRACRGAEGGHADLVEEDLSARAPPPVVTRYRALVRARSS